MYKPIKTTYKLRCGNCMNFSINEKNSICCYYNKVFPQIVII